MELNIASNLKELRKVRGNTQEELARHLDISVQAVSKWERGEGLPDITLLPRLAAFYGTTVDHILCCDEERKQEEIGAFIEQANILTMKAKEKELLDLCYEMQKKYPRDENVLFFLMINLYKMDRIQNHAVIIRIAEKLMNTGNPGQRFTAIRCLAYTYDEIGNHEKALEYARMIPDNKDLLVQVLKGKECADHCKRFFWNTCDRLNDYLNFLLAADPTGYSHEEQHTMYQAIITVYHTIFANGDFGFYHERLGGLYYHLAICSAEAGDCSRAFDELGKMIAHFKQFDIFTATAVDHTSLFVRGLHFEASMICHREDLNLCAEYAQMIRENPAFNGMREDERYKVLLDRMDSKPATL